MKNCCQWALAVTCMVLLAACSAQPPAGSPPPALSPAPVPTVTPAPQLPVTNLVTTPDGALWYAYGNFDFHPRGGGIVRTLQGETTYFFPTATAQLLAVAPDGTRWAGMGCQLLRFESQSWQTLIENCDLLHGNIIDVAFTSDGALWAASGFALGHYTNGAGPSTTGWRITWP